MATKVLNPNEEKVVKTNKQESITGLPLSLMGPPISESSMLDWCYKNMDKIDKKELDTAIISALSKTLKTKGFELSKQRLHRSNMFRLVSKNHLIVEGPIIIKEE
jgi:hypothetical protein